MPELTDEQRADCQKVLDAIVNYWWTKIDIKMRFGLTFEAALEEVKKEFFDA